DNGVSKAYIYWLGTVKYLEYLLACWPTSHIGQLHRNCAVDPRLIVFEPARPGLPHNTT
ncbi:hypothetical protein PpBr36_05172, partial [Pyricularia pennisetigena]|uniref:hypothetical protein n=1 Tax=Pyricularia pennisetigena TaxID=1578925 RepID=UPI00115020DB